MGSRLVFIELRLGPTQRATNNRLPTLTRTSRNLEPLRLLANTNQLERSFSGAYAEDGALLLAYNSVAVSCATNKLYRVNRSVTLLPVNCTVLASGLAGTPPVNRFTDTTASDATAFYWIEQQE